MTPEKRSVPTLPESEDEVEIPIRNQRRQKGKMSLYEPKISVTYLYLYEEHY
jgi:hypothetical protein